MQVEVIEITIAVHPPGIIWNNKWPDDIPHSTFKLVYVLQILFYQPMAGAFGTNHPLLNASNPDFSQVWFVYFQGIRGEAVVYYREPL